MTIGIPGFISLEEKDLFKRFFKNLNLNIFILPLNKDKIKNDILYLKENCDYIIIPLEYKCEINEKIIYYKFKNIKEEQNFFINIGKRFKHSYHDINNSYIKAKIENMNYIDRLKRNNINILKSPINKIFH